MSAESSVVVATPSSANVPVTRLTLTQPAKAVRLHVFQRKYQDTDQASTEAVQTLGHVKHTQVLKRVVDATYRTEMRKRLHSIAQPGSHLKRKMLKHSAIRSVSRTHLARVKELGVYQDPAKDLDSPTYLFKYFVPSEVQKGSDNPSNKIQHSSRAYSGLRLTEDQAKEGIFKIFEQRRDQGVRFKEFQASIRVPHAMLKTLLEGIANFVSKDNQRPMWYLKKEYSIGNST